MAVKDELVQIEKNFWSGDADWYRRNLDESCLVAFTEMAGLLDKQQIVDTIKGGDRWRDLDVTVKGVIEPVPGVAILTYEAHAKRMNGEDYAAIVSTGYARRNGAWKMTFHQHTPLTGNAAPPRGA